MEAIFNFLSGIREAVRGALPEHAEFYFAGGLAFFLVLFFLVRIFGRLKELASDGDKRGKEMVRHFDNLEPMFKSAVGNMIELEIGRLKSLLESRLKMMRDVAGKSGEENGGSGEDKTSGDEEPKTAAARAEEHRIAVEERLDSIAELVKQRPPPAATAAADKPEESEKLADVRAQLDKLSLYLHDEFAAVAAKLDAQKPAAQASGGDNTAVLEMLNQSMNRLSGEVDAKLTLLNSKLEKNMETKMSDALASMNSLREQIESLAGAGEQMKSINQNMTSLSRLMMARSGVDEHGARQQLSELLTQILSAEHFMLDVDLPNGHCAAAMVRFPDPKDSVAIDAGLSLAAFIESLDETAPAAERDAKRQAFRQELVSHINHVADNLISPPHTGESALLFVSSEAAFAEIHGRHRAAVKLALSRRVWLVSPTTLLAVVNTANTAIRDHEARIQLQQMQESVTQIVEEARHFENRLTEIGDHVNSAWRSVQRAESASGRLIGSIRNISGREKIGGAYPPVADDS